MNPPPHKPSGHRHVLLALSWFYPEMHQGIARYARDHRWHLTVEFDGPMPNSWVGDGILTHLGADPHLWRVLRRHKVPTVDLTESRPTIPLPRVTMDNAAIGQMGAQHFLNRGFTNIAFYHRWELGVSQRRRAAFKQTLHEAGQDCQVLTWEKERGNKADTRAERHTWLVRELKKLPKPLAVYTVRDAEGSEIIEACMDAGFAVPEQVCVLGTDNMETICDCLMVPLSSIDCNREQVGYEGAALLDQLMDGKEAPPAPIYVQPNGIVERRSTDALAVDHPGVAAALRYIQLHFPEPIGTVEIARKVGLSRSGLEKAFREHYIRPPGEELRRVRLERAQEMLKHTDEKVLAIAVETGFQTPQQLCRIFRQRLGITPKQFRMRAR